MMARIPLIERELQSLEKELHILELIINKRNINPLDDIETRGAALSLASLYNGMERILKQIITDRGEPITENPNWHRGLLQRSASLRIITEKTMQDMRGFLSFRHFVRHAYSFEIDPKAIDAILDAAPDLVKRFITEIRDQNELSKQS